MSGFRRVISILASVSLILLLLLTADSDDWNEVTLLFQATCIQSCSIANMIRAYSGISNVYRPQFPMITMDIPQPVVPCYLGNVRLDESADTRKRSWERVDSRTYPDSEESEDDVVYSEEDEEEIQQINLRNEVTNQIPVDTCDERCACVDDFNFVLPAKVWNEESDTPESDFETSDSGKSIHVNASDSSSSETETTSQRLSSPPVVAQTRPKGGCQTAMPRRKRRRRSVRTTDSASAMDTRQESVAPSTLDSDRIHKKSECITKGEAIREAAPPASHGMAQPKCSDTPAEKPPAEMNICNTPDNLQIEMSVMLLKMADGSPSSEEIYTYRFGDTTDGVIHDDGNVKKMDGEVCHEPRSVVFGRFNVRLRS